MNRVVKTAAALLAGIYWFVTFEQTALPTVPRRAAAPLSVRIPPPL